MSHNRHVNFIMVSQITYNFGLFNALLRLSQMENQSSVSQKGQ